MKQAIFSELIGSREALGHESDEHRQSIDQLINWRMCKKQQMGWSRAGAQQLLQRENPRLSTGGWTGIPGIILYRRLSPHDPQIFADLDLSTVRQPYFQAAYKFGNSDRSRRPSSKMAC